MTESERARLLALDRRRRDDRYGLGPGEAIVRERDRQKDSRHFWEKQNLRDALCELLGWHDAPPQGWTAGMIRRLDEIRELAKVNRTCVN